MNLLTRVHHGNARQLNSVRARIGCDGPHITLQGRSAWALLQLIDAGAQGVTPIECVGPRWAAYIHKLRKAGVAVETIRESHGGAFPGQHARYVLGAPVFIENR